MAGHQRPAARHSTPIEKTRIKGSSVKTAEWNEEQMARQQPELNLPFSIA
jgi:hypothetical protein